MRTQKEIEDQLSSLIIIKNRCVNNKHYFQIEHAIQVLRWVIEDDGEVESPSHAMEHAFKKFAELDYVNSLER